MALAGLTARGGRQGRAAAEPSPRPGGEEARAAKAARDSERRRLRREARRTERGRHAEAAVRQMLFALDLIPAGEEYDEWRSVVHRACLRIRKSARRTPDGDMEAVMAAMRKPLVLTAEEIALEAGLPRRDVERILSAMLAAGAAVRRERGTLLPARGPKVWLYRLTG